MQSADGNTVQQREIRRPIRSSLDDKIFGFGVYVFLTIIIIAVAYPIIYIISSSFSSAEDVILGKVWLFPVHPTFEAYSALFQQPLLLGGIKNSIFYTLFGTLLSVTLTIMMAYPLSRQDFYGRNVFMILLTITMFFSGGLIPLYMTVKSLGLLDTRLAVILPSALGIWHVIVARTFFQSTISTELAEAADMDGCSDYKFILKIVLPLSKPIIAVLSLIYAVAQWNSYFNALIFLNDPTLYPLQVILRNILILNQNLANMTGVDPQRVEQMLNMAELLKYALIVVSSLPIVLIYPFAQKYFIKGMMVGSIKG